MSGITMILSIGLGASWGIFCSYKKWPLSIAMIGGFLIGTLIEHFMI